jgi:hypothetical protein
VTVVSLCVRPANQPTLMAVALCHKTFRQHCLIKMHHITKTYMAFLSDPTPDGCGSLVFSSLYPPQRYPYDENWIIGRIGIVANNFWESNPCRPECSHLFHILSWISILLRCISIQYLNAQISVPDICKKTVNISLTLIHLYF